MSHSYSGARTDDAESIRTIHRALELGVALIDIAEFYGPFINEEIVGRAIKGRRDGIVLATKLGLISHGADGPKLLSLNSSPVNIRTARSRGPSGGSIPTASTCTTSTGSTRTPLSRKRSGAGRAGVRRQDPSHRLVRGRAQHDPSSPWGPYLTALHSEYFL
jgi:hypothetical protein